MEAKIKKWSKILKWLLVSALIWYGIGLVISLPNFLAPEKWTIEYAAQDVMEQLGNYIDTEVSPIILQPDAAKQHLLEKSYYLYGRIAEIIFNAALFIMGFLIMQKLSKDVIFDSRICLLTRWAGILICIGSIVIPSLARHKSSSSFVLVEGFGFDIIMDCYRLGCGVAIILLAYILSQGQFLQEEYDTTL